MKRRLLAAVVLMAGIFYRTTGTAQRGAAPFVLEETTITQIQGALRGRQLTCRSLVDSYLKRIEAYDK